MYERRDEHRHEAVVHANGWFEIRDRSRPERWIAIDSPVEALP